MRYFSLGVLKIHCNSLLLFFFNFCVLAFFTSFDLREFSSIFFRFKPFFPFQVLPPDEYEDRDLCIQDFLLTEGRLKVTLIECTRYVLWSFAQS